MSRSLILPDDLVDRLERTAGKRGASVDQLIAEALLALEPGREQEGPPSAAAAEEELLAACTRALLDGEDPPIPADWDELREALSGSEAPYATVEEAMSAARQRAWKKDE